MSLKIHMHEYLDTLVWPNIQNSLFTKIHARIVQHVESWIEEMHSCSETLPCRTRRSLDHVRFLRSSTVMWIVGNVWEQRFHHIMTAKTVRTLDSLELDCILTKNGNRVCKQGQPLVDQLLLRFLLCSFKTYKSKPW